MFAKTCFLFAGFFLLCDCWGCSHRDASETSAVQVIPESIDTQSDLRHDHTHLHGDPHRHDHQHEQSFVGAHAHPHVHVHRHQASPHAGTIVSLRWTGTGAKQTIDLKAKVPLAPHLEVVAELPDQLWFYLLDEVGESGWRPWEFAPSELQMELSIEGNAVKQSLTWDSQKEGYRFVVPVRIRSTMGEADRKIRFEDWLIRAGELVFDSPTDLIYENSRLEVAID